MTGSSAAADLSAWLAYLETLHPKSIDLGLDRIRSVAQVMALVPASIPTVTVAGTNGKGSCVASLQALLRAGGHSVGVYTSPHLIRFNERIVINGEPATDAQILEAFHAIESARGSVTLSYFEFATLAALWLFRRAGVDWQILEVGLGGRLDAVNIVDASACVITSIGLDHTEWLGDTRELIAPEKAGVARPGAPAIVAEPDPPATLSQALLQQGADSRFIGWQWTLEGAWVCVEGRRYPLPPVPGLQPGNIAAAIVALDALDALPGPEQVAIALAQLSVPGRQQQLNVLERDWWFDVSHNRESVQALASALARAPTAAATHAVFGAMADKPLRAMISAMANVVDYWHLPATPELARAADPKDIRALLQGAEAVLYPSASEAWEGVLQASNAGDRVIVFGSFVVVGAQMALLGEQQASRETEDS